MLSIPPQLEEEEEEMGEGGGDIGGRRARKKSKEKNKGEKRALGGGGAEGEAKEVLSLGVEPRASEGHFFLHLLLLFLFVCEFSVSRVSESCRRERGQRGPTGYQEQPEQA